MTPPQLKIVGRAAITSILKRFDPPIIDEDHDGDDSSSYEDESDGEADDGDFVDPESALPKWPCDVVNAAAVDQDGGDGDQEETSSCMHIWDYHGQEWRDMIAALRKVEPITQPEFLITELHPYQLQGIAKLMHILQHGPLDGVILGDVMGLGKTIQAVVACELRGGEPGCVNLIVTTRSSAPQFRVEILSRYKPENYPHVLLVKSYRDIPLATDLIARKWDWVIMTYDQLLALYKSLQKSKRENKLQKASFFSDLFRDTNSWIRHLVVDEVTNALRTRGKRHSALKKLRYRKALLLSGTFIPDKWYEVYDILDLMPRVHPYHHKALFKSAFLVPEDSIKTKKLSQSYIDRLVLFLLPNVVARPSRVLELPYCTSGDILYKLDSHDASEVTRYVEKFYHAVRMSKGSASQSIETEDDKAKALRSAVIAQQIGASPLLLTKKKDKESHLGELGKLSKPSDDDALAKLLVETGILKYGAAIDEDELSTLVEKAAQALDNGAFRRKNIHTDDRDDDVDMDGAQPSDLGDAAFSPGQGYDEDQWYDKDYAPEPEGNAGEENDDIRAHDFDSRQQRNEWLDSLRNHAEDDTDFQAQLYSPKVNAILAKIKVIYNESKNNKKKGPAKILVFSKFLRFLDVLGEAMRRSPDFAKHESGSIEPFLFHGQLNTEERRAVISSFSSNQNWFQPLFITQQAGGCALNIEAASRVIICEPWWCQNDRLQAIARCYRQGQQRQVYVYDVVGNNSLIDWAIMVVRDRKDNEVRKLVDMIRVEDGQEPDIPVIYHAPTNYQIVDPVQADK